MSYLILKKATDLVPWSYLQKSFDYMNEAHPPSSVLYLGFLMGFAVVHIVYLVSTIFFKIMDILLSPFYKLTQKYRSSGVILVLILIILAILAHPSLAMFISILLVPKSQVKLFFFQFLFKISLFLERNTKCFF